MHSHKNTCYNIRKPLPSTRIWSVEETCRIGSTTLLGEDGWEDGRMQGWSGVETLRITKGEGVGLEKRSPKEPDVGVTVTMWQTITWKQGTH